MIAPKSLYATRTFSWLLGSCLLLAAYGCGQPEPPAPTNPIPDPIPEPAAVAPAPPVSNQSPIPPVEADTGSGGAVAIAPEPTEAEKAVTERLAVAGIEDPQATKDFIAKMREAASAGDKETIASLVRYPFTTYDAGEPIDTYETASDLLANYEQVVTPDVIEAMAAARYADLFANYQGAMIGNGAVWFSQFGDEIEITAINGL